MSITRMDAPIISKQAMIQFIQILIPRRLERECNMYDVGYEAAKRDIAATLGRYLGTSLDVNPALELIRNLKSSD